MISVTLIAIHKHRNWCRLFHTLNGLFMAILKSKEMGGLETPGLGSLMSEAFLVVYISTRYGRFFS